MAEESYGKSYVEVERYPVVKCIWESSLREPDVLRQIRDETQKSLGRASIMLVDPIESQCLRFLIGACGAKRCLDIFDGHRIQGCDYSLCLILTFILVYTTVPTTIEMTDTFRMSQSLAISSFKGPYFSIFSSSFSGTLTSTCTATSIVFTSLCTL